MSVVGQFKCPRCKRSGGILVHRINKDKKPKGFITILKSLFVKKKAARASCKYCGYSWEF